MIKRILIAVLAVLLIAFVFIFIRTRPSGDIVNYEKYYTNDTSQVKENGVKVTFFGVSALLFDD